MKTFKDKGKRSRAWWLQLIKEHGADGSAGYIQEKGLVNVGQFKPAIDELLGGRYVEIMIGSRPALPGEMLRGKKPTYRLTSLGHRYLAEHPEELEEPGLPEPDPVEPVRHSVPEMSIPRVEEKPERSYAIAPAEDRHDTARHTARQIVKEMVDEPAPEGQESAMPERVKPLVLVGAQAETGDLIAGFKAALSEILIERFADQVTAKDVLDRLERNNKKEVV